MLVSLKTRAETRRKAGEIYGVVVAQVRQPAFYESYGVPDTPAGRYELLALHLHLVLERLRGVLPADAPLPRVLVETFVADIDDSLRELGTGDVAVPRRVRKATAGLYERATAYRAALAEADDVLAAALAEHVYYDAAAPQAAELATYVRGAAARLQTSDDEAVMEGRFEFPPPVAEGS
jgi:cytochrome b pre-mRNA-processing protein 3